MLKPSDQLEQAVKAHQQGDYAYALATYRELLEQHPSNQVVWRGLLLTMQYDPSCTTSQRLATARRWAAVTVSNAGQCIQPRPKPLHGRKLRVAYIGADFCQHTVGLFLRPVLKTHDATKISLTLYSAGRVVDWLTEEFQGVASRWVDVAGLPDEELAKRIRQDEIDILVDLAGHTAGSRLAVFAYKPSPVLVSWLGYFATSGFAHLDGVLLDAWHAPRGAEQAFAEPIIRLPNRLCYSPVPWAPQPSRVPPCKKRGHITFGCFNNTAKLAPQVFVVWAKLLEQVANSRLILKWRSFGDTGFCAEVRAKFEALGVQGDRIELRGQSFHVDVLHEYADIDIALDPFPFTGGLTSCEALWMGVPVVTWPQQQVVSRQTHAFVHQIGLPELSANSADEYVQIAAGLAADPERLEALRREMRPRMASSPLMNAYNFTRALEDIYFNLYENKLNRTLPQ